jgi:hypothetical protein
MRLEWKKIIISFEKIGTGHADNKKISFKWGWPTDFYVNEFFY